MELHTYIAYLLATIVIVMVPGPTVTLVVASGMRHGARAALLNVGGTLAGVAMVFAVVGIGLASAIAAMGHWFEYIRFIGAAYLVWIGMQMLLARGGPAEDAAPPTPRMGFFAQGLLVAISNPKTLFFFGAFIPQFIDPAGSYPLQIAIMGITAMFFGAVSDSTYALAAARAGRALSAKRFRMLTRIGGGFLVGGGLWLAFSRVR
ncbi:MAG: transporter [Rhizobiales bacterium 65-79]|nr:LysE family translocator [Hyphomicrobiales bacterium]OJU05581.1 MAG: transporter [Rhizobiales bacterium 65-79]